MAEDLVLMLEDDHERLERFLAVLRQVNPELGLHVWRDANVMIRQVASWLPRAALISLDHDLEPDAGGTDSGDGLAVVKCLVAQPIKRPTIIHSSNSGRSRWMAGEFDLAEWKHWRVAPIGDDWIEADWQAVVREILRDALRFPA